MEPVERESRAGVLMHAKEIADTLGKALRDSAPRTELHEATPTMLAVAIHDGLRAVLVASGTQGETQTPALARAAVESLADLTSCIADPAYARWLYHRALRARIEMWKDYLNVDPLKPDGSNALAHERATQRIAMDTDLVAQIESQGVPKRIKMHEKFQNTFVHAGMHEVYRQLCGPGHNDAISLQDRYLDETESGLRFRLGMPLASWVLFDLVYMTSAVATQVISHIPKFADCDPTMNNAHLKSALTSLDKLTEVKNADALRHWKLREKAEKDSAQRRDAAT